MARSSIRDEKQYETLREKGASKEIGLSGYSSKRKADLVSELRNH